MENFDIINKNSAAEMKEKYNNSENWRNYAKRCIKNPFLKKFLLNKYSNICQFCMRPVTEKYQIHHISYDNECCYDSTISILSPTEKRPDRMIKIPDCEYCFHNNKEYFDKCVKNLTIVHGICNMLIHDHFTSEEN